MGCGCGGSKNSSYNYVFTDSNGVQKTYSSELEAKAAQMRSGGGGNVRAVAK